MDPPVAASFDGGRWHVVAAAIRGHGLAGDARSQWMRVTDLRGLQAWRVASTSVCDNVACNILKLYILNYP